MQTTLVISMLMKLLISWDMWKVCAIYGILSSVHYRGSDSTSTTACPLPLRDD